MGTASSGEAGRPPIRTLVMATLCNSAAVLPAGLTLILAVQIRTDLGITVLQFGLAFTVYSAGIALFSATLGQRADRLGWRRSMMLSLAVSTSVLLVMAAATGSLASLLPLLFVAGINVAFAVPTTALCAAIVFLAASGMWRGDVRTPNLAAATEAPDPPRGQGSIVTRPGGPNSGLEHVGLPEGFRLLAVGTALAAASVSGVVGFAVLSAVDVGMSEAAAGLLIAAASVAGIIADIGVGAVADHRRSGGFPEASAVLALGAVGYAILIMPSPVAAVVGTFFGYMFGWAFSGLLHLGAVTAHSTAPAAATGMVQVGAGVGLSVGPIVFGTLVDVSGYQVAWATMTALAIAAAATIRLAANRLPGPIRDLRTAPV